MALILDLIDKEKTYPAGSAEALWVTAYVDGFSMAALDVMSRHLDRYKQEDLAVVEGDLRAVCGQEGLAFARWIQGYIGFDGKLPKIDPDMWVKKRDEAGRWVTTPGGIGSGTRTVKSPTTGRSWTGTPMGTGTGTATTWSPMTFSGTSSPSSSARTIASTSSTSFLPSSTSSESSSTEETLAPWQKEFLKKMGK